MKHKSTSGSSAIKTISLPKKLFEQAKERAAKNGLGFSAWIRTLVIKDMDANK